MDKTNIPPHAVIYALINPKSGEIFYIGKTTNPDLRLAAHKKDRRKNARTQKIRQMLKDGVEPVMIYLEWVPKGTRWQEREQYWIEFGRSHAWNLTNVADGGDGPPPAYRNTPPAQRRRMRSIHI